MLGTSDIKLVLEEIREILGVERDDPILILETVRKMEKVVKAVPRMENFITSISRGLAEDPAIPIPLEQLLPRIAFLRHLET